MAPSFDNFSVPWSCVRPPECRTKVSSLGARRMLAKLRELYKSRCPHLAKNPGVAWGNTCLDRSCEQRPNVVLEATLLCWGRPEAMLGTVML
jgi:hypothetical protein